MDKKDKTITISRKKLWITGIIITLIASVIYGVMFTYFTKDILADHKIVVENSYFIKTLIIMCPIMIILIGTVIAATFAFLDDKKNK